MKFDAILFDLDNTLLLFDEPPFFDAYSKGLYSKFADIMSPREFGKRLMTGTQTMVQNDGSKLNLDVFIPVFSNGLPIDSDESWHRFDDYYHHGFPKLQVLTEPIPGVRDLFLELLNHEMALVIATNPLFPLHVQQQRLSWAGLADIAFDHISSVENSRYCKPNLNYYKALCNAIDAVPEKCLMVGNDPNNDLVAGKLGMSTFLTTDSADKSLEKSEQILNNPDVELPTPDYRGSIRELAELI